jgi:hypothetical protein
MQVTKWRQVVFKSPVHEPGKRPEPDQTRTTKDWTISPVLSLFGQRNWFNRTSFGQSLQNRHKIIFSYLLLSKHTKHLTQFQTDL